MNTIFTVLAKVIEAAAIFSSESTSAIVLYQPKKPECLCKKESDEK